MAQDVPKPLSFPAYRRSHFRSQTYVSLVRIFSHFPPILDNGEGRIEQEKPEKKPEFSEFVGSTSVDPKDPAPEKIIQKVHETTEGVRDKGMVSGSKDVVLCDIERTLGMDELMDYQVEHIEFQHSIVNKSGNASDLQVMECKMTSEKKNGDLEDGELDRDFAMDDECGPMLKPGNNEDRQIGSKRASHMPTNYVQSQALHRALLEEEDKQDEGNSFASKQRKVNISDKKKHGPSFEERKAKRKRKKQKNQEKKNKQLGVKRLKFPQVGKPKTIAYCRHYLIGRCHQGDKCQFSHDTVPLTKSKPCRHYARHSCMKGDDCPFDHELSKYPCDNFVSRGFCSRGNACLFSHQLPPKEDSLPPSGIYRPELKSPLLSENTSFRVSSNNHGCSSVQQTHLTNSMGIRSHIDPEDKVIVQKHVAPPPKGIRFINIANSSLASHTTPKQGLITPNKESLVQIGACSDRSASGTHQTLGEILKRLPAVAPKGANFLCFGKGSICIFETSISSLLNKENGIKVPQFFNFDLPNHSGSSLQKDDHSNCNTVYASIATPSMLLVSQFGLQQSS